MNLRDLVIPLCSALVLAASLGSQPVDGRPLAAEDLTKTWNAEDAVISHDGKSVAFVEMRVDAAKNAYKHNIWIVPAAGGAARQLTRGDDDADPQWTPDDATIVFSSGRPGKSQIYRIALGGGEAEKLTDAMHGASSARISHDGNLVAYLRNDIDEQPRTNIDWKALGITPTEKQRKSDIRHIGIQHFEDNGRGETYANHAHVVVMHLDGSAQKQLTRGKFSEGDLAWSPDDTTIAFDSNRRDGEDYDRSQLFTVPAGGGTERAIPIDRHTMNAPVYLHDGRIAYLTNSHEDPATLQAIQIAAPDGTNDTNVVPENTVATGDAILADVIEGGAGCGPLFAKDDRSFVADVSAQGKSELERFDVATGNRTPLGTGDGEVADCSMDASGSTIAYTFDDATHPPEVYSLDIESGKTRKLTDLNHDFLDTVTLSTIEPFAVTDRAGFPVSAWFMKAANAMPGRRYPTLLEIHGGPETEYGNAYFQEMQYLSARGFNVVFADPRGSVGFGYPFEAALSKNWGDPMFEDEMAVLDEAVKRPDVDTKRLGVLGGSYGGYATLWMVSHTDRFKAGIAERVCSDLVSLSFASDFSQIPDAKYSWGAPWADIQTYRKQSPFYFVTNVHTPLLMIHSDQDIRTPVDQTYEEYTALKSLGKPVELAEFPRENHDLSRTGEPLHRIERLHLLADYFTRTLR